jgi:hypothetical protein
MSTCDWCGRELTYFDVFTQYGHLVFVCLAGCRRFR